MSFEVVFLILVIATTVPLTLFPFVFAIGARRSWWRTPAGRAVMVSSASTVAVLYSVLARQLFGDYEHREVVLLTVFSGVCLGAWLLLGALIHELRQGRLNARRRRALTEHPDTDW